MLIMLSRICLPTLPISGLAGLMRRQGRLLAKFSLWSFKVDIVEYYPSISEKLLRNALSYASQFVDIQKDHIEIIMHCRKSLLFENEHPWVKKDKDNMFDVTMGYWDGAEVCELMGAYIPGKLTSFFNISNIGFYRDDGLAILKATSGSETERIKKRIVKVFKDQGLRVTISPYRKPNDTPCYVNKLPNHPPTILQNIHDAINRRVASISSSEQVYHQAIPTYKEALKNSGYSTPISYPDKNLTSRKRQRKRKVIWFNPPFSKSVATNVSYGWLISTSRSHQNSVKYLIEIR